jgi:hypothetical protein
MLPQFIVFLSGDFKKDKKHHDRYSVYQFILADPNCTRDEVCLNFGFTSSYVNSISEYLSRNEIIDFSHRVNVNGKFSHVSKNILKDFVLDTSLIVSCSLCGKLVDKSRNATRKDICSDCTKQHFNTAKEYDCFNCAKKITRKNLRRYKKQDCCKDCSVKLLSP